MRILFVVHGYLPQGTGGVELYSSSMAKELAKGHDISVFCRGNDPEKEDYLKEEFTLDGVPVSRINYCFRDLSRFEDIYLNRRIQDEFDLALTKLKPHVVHVHHLTCLSTSIPEVIRRRDVPQVMSLHDFWMGCPRGKRIQSDSSLCPTIDRTKCLSCTAEIWGAMVRAETRLQKWFGLGDPLFKLNCYDQHIRHVLEIPELLLTPSEFARQKFIEYGVEPRRIRSLAYGLNTQLGRHLDRTPSSKVRFAFLGSVIPSKGADVLLEAFRLLDDPRACLDLYGELIPEHGDENYLRRLQTQIDETPQARIHGRYENPELPQILSQVDVLVVPSIWYETYCITIREGFLANVPVIASDLGAMGEAIEDGVSGLLFRPGDARDLSRQMGRLLDDPSLRQELSGQAARVKGIREHGRELLGIYREVRERHRSVEPSTLRHKRNPMSPPEAGRSPRENRS